MAGKPEFEWWRQLTPGRRAKHQKLIKILNLTPFLYSQICQPDNWIRYAHQVGLLPSESINVKNSDSVDEQLFEKICLVEECNDLVAAEMTKKKYLERVEILLQKVTVDTPVDEVVSQANSNSVIKHWRDKISYKQPSTVNVALLFVCWKRE
ncbi:hypothetical protein LSAT2_006838 [Lamellibrachia satsuma]|nr:hypothetical protein LSAT2_006838 [Lamellibrachia satsuma]